VKIILVLFCLLGLFFGGRKIYSGQKRGSFSEKKVSEGKISEEKVSEGKVSERKVSEGKVSEGKVGGEKVGEPGTS
jgi:uncharacterized low-complexity protein